MSVQCIRKCTINTDKIYTTFHQVHTLIMWPLASERTLSYATPQCVGILLTFFIIQVMWSFAEWKYVLWQMLGKVQHKNTTGLGCTKLIPFSPTTSQQHAPKINWTVPYRVCSKLKSGLFSHQITFLVNSTFGKTLHINPSSSLTILSRCERCLWFS